MQKSGGPSRFSAVEPDFRFKGMEMGLARKIVATEDGRSHKVRLFAGQQCPHLDTTLTFPSDIAEAVTPDLPSSISGLLSGGDCGIAVSFSATAVDILAATQKIIHYAIWTN